ncbi:DinI-like family protein [Salmonella enterica]|nr:DinI-like family protein [Salmonella enterica]
MRLEILFDREAKIPVKTMDELYHQVEKRLSPLYPRLTLRIAKGSSSAVQVSGAKTDEERESVMSILREIWEDDSWLPE